MPNTYQLGRLGRVYVAQESAYGTGGTFTGAKAVRHLDVRLNMNPRNRVDSPERHSGHPDQLFRFTRRTTASALLKGLLYPSNTLNTVPEADLIFKNAFGASTNKTLSTTVSSGGTTTGAIVASAGTLAIGDAVLINATGGPFVRILTNVVTNTLTWAPALPTAAANGNTVKGCVTYQLATAVLGSLNIGHYLTSVGYEALGFGLDTFKLLFDANEEGQFEASGPMQRRNRLTTTPAAQADPVTFTTVGAGSGVPSGLTGYLRVNGANYEFLKASFEMDNGLDLDNVAFGTSQAQALYRKSKRHITCQIDAMYSSDLTLLNDSELTSDDTIFLQQGTTEGSIFALYAPKVEFDVADDPNEEETMQHSFHGVCKGTSGNDALYLVAA